MTPSLVYSVAGVIVLSLGFYHVLAQDNLLRKALAANFVSTGIFVLIVALADRIPGRAPDPVPHAMVLTGIVVAVSSTALLLTLVCLHHQNSGSHTLDVPDNKGSES